MGQNLYRNWSSQDSNILTFQNYQNSDSISEKNFSKILTLKKLSHKNAIKRVKGAKKWKKIGKNGADFLPIFEASNCRFCRFFFKLKPIFGQKELATLKILAILAKNWTLQCLYFFLTRRTRILYYQIESRVQIKPWPT